LSLPATEEHNCQTCGKTRVLNTQTLDPKKLPTFIICRRKRIVKEGYCCEWIGGK